MPAAEPAILRAVGDLLPLTIPYGHRPGPRMTEPSRVSPDVSQGWLAFSGASHNGIDASSWSPLRNAGLLRSPVVPYSRGLAAGQGPHCEWERRRRAARAAACRGRAPAAACRAAPSPLCPVMPYFQVGTFRALIMIVASFGRYGRVDKQSVGHTFESRGSTGLREVRTSSLFSDAAYLPLSGHDHETGRAEGASLRSWQCAGTGAMLHRCRLLWGADGLAPAAGAGGVADAASVTGGAGRGEGGAGRARGRGGASGLAAAADGAWP